MVLVTLSNEQKTQVRNAFTLIDSDSKDGKITLSDLVNVHKTLGLELPSDETLKDMLGGGDSITFAQFSQVIAVELSKVDDKTTIVNALKVFTTEENKFNLIVDFDELKEACCSVQLGDIGSGDHRLSRQAFDSLTKGFVKEQMDGKKLFYGSNWIGAYIE
ncbi:hypothetical protein FOB63_004068 [Clavispora lusitaniae]|uniref:EF-hand domain-containing protein n=2 Tax=Clavispora lusitaniae TaxID=36911 RepID=C4Y9V5_CLAL4|nr:uncharacterized protein CLUG_05176 [Clavispora lusitaniae ATCC 42720]EEQ41048.1 hypothetical protein CLUG_05176 [Clavispora lusitaniae ATCC 42720]KAF7580766.1 hypothetical protein FOB63_004068 [Clavispora lusitaniae]OVF09936.1 putative calmodulin [Clavispora lusitaniae]